MGLAPPVLILLIAFSAGVASQGCSSAVSNPSPSCQAGPCNCTSYQVLYVFTDGSTNITTITWNITNICSTPLRSVGIGINSPLALISPTAGTYNSPQTYSGSLMGVYTASVTSSSGNPSFAMIAFTPRSSGQYANGAWDIFTLEVNGYTPDYLFNLQSQSGNTLDTYAGFSMALCACDNCNAGQGTPASRPQCDFRESETLVAYRIQGNSLQVFFGDEQAPLLGCSKISLTNSSGTFNFTSPVTPSSSSTPVCVDNPLVGFTDETGLLAGVDTMTCPTVPCGRPLTPTVFITDITTDPNSTAGDWQYFGRGTPLHRICGMWKQAIRFIAYPSSVSIKMPPNPTSNGWNLGPGSDAPPPGVTTYLFGAEAVWYLDRLGLLPGHSYRFQFIVHDGDQNQAGGDAGEGCIYATAACPSGWTGASCTSCDVDPAVGYTWYCVPVGNPISSYDLIKIPLSYVANYSHTGGFIPSNGSVIDGQGFAITCDCQRKLFPCPNGCSANGVCQQNTGICKCNPGWQPPNCSICCNETLCNNTPPWVPPPCFNNGLYCSGHGTCNQTNNQCICVYGYNGTICDHIIPPPPIPCQNFNNNCSACVLQNCVWCSSPSGHCSPSQNCTKGPSRLCPIVPPHHKNNAGVIAGAVVGGALAAAALLAVAYLVARRHGAASLTSATLFSNASGAGVSNPLFQPHATEMKNPLLQNMAF